MRLQVGVDEGEMGEFVVGVVVDVLGHVRVEHRERVCVIGIATAAGHFAVLDAAELVVLLPGIGLEDLGRGEELENRRVSRGEAAACKRRRRIGQQPPGADSSCSGRGALEQEGATGVEIPFGRFHAFSLLRVRRAKNERRAHASVVTD